MPSHGRVVACLLACLVLIPTTAFAQPRPKDATLVLVAPGNGDLSTLTSVCPSFSWVPANGAASYELAVFDVDAGQLASAPRLHVAVPTGSATWTPPVTSCLPADREYQWFMRQIGQPNRPVGEWSAGLRFSVTDAAPGSIEAAGGKADSTSAAAGEPGRKDETRLNPLDSLAATLVVINEKLDQLLNPDPFSREFCFEAGAEVGLGPEVEIKLTGEGEGRVGAEGYGNGLMAKVRARTEATFAGELKGAGAAKFSWCWDKGSAASPATAPDQRSASLVAAATMSDGDLAAKMSGLADQLQMNDQRLSAIADLLPVYSSEINPFQAARSQNSLSDMADIVPLPEAIRAKLRDPSQIVAGFRAQLALCGQSDLPPAIAGLVGEFCGLAENERFSRLLDRVDGTVSNVRTTVNTVRTRIEDVIDALPVVGDCKLFCQ